MYRVTVLDTNTELKRQHFLISPLFIIFFFTFLGCVNHGHKTCKIYDDDKYIMMHLQSYSMRFNTLPKSSAMEFLVFPLLVPVHGI